MLCFQLTPLQPMWRVALLVTLLTLPVWAASAEAASSPRTESVVAGPYPLLVTLSADPPIAGDDLSVQVASTGEPSGLQRVHVVAHPGLGTSSTPIRAELQTDGDQSGRFAGSVHLPVVGAWIIEVDADGPQGEGQALVAITAASPGAMPVWLGWVLAFAPGLGVVWFGWRQYRGLRRLQAHGLTEQPW